MAARTAKVRVKRLFRRQKKQVASFGNRAEAQLERNFVRKFSRLQPVRRFILAWVMLCLILVGVVVVQTRALGGYYQTLQPAPGGIYSEGIIGTYTNINPLYATGQVNDAVSKLVFAGLFKYDEANKLVGDLAQGWQADEDGTSYTVTLRPDLQWHDGQPLTAEDVAFTYQQIQNPDVQSPLNVSWQGVQVAARDKRTIVFTLPNPLSSFPYSLTNGIVPKHILKDVEPGNLRSVSFNTSKPVGAGPFQFKTVEVRGNSPSTRQEEIALTPFEQYHDGAPKLSTFIIRTFPDENRLLSAFRDHVVTAIVGAQRVPDDLSSDSNVQEYRMPLTAANMVFFKTSDGVLKNKEVRQALVGSTDVAAVTSKLPQPILPVREPVLQGSPGYDPANEQLKLGPDKAAELLDQQGWKVGGQGIREKDGQKLTFRLYAQDTAEYRMVASSLRQQWKKIGVDAQVYLQSDSDLRTTIYGVGGNGGHSYDALLYGISLGVDPDQFVYWHGTQADIRSPSRLNFSEYNSDTANAALEAGRTRADPLLRAVKYQPFFKAWQDDAPALGLYQPRFLYVTHGQVYNLHDHTLTADTDRFNNVNDWMIREAPKAAED